MRIFLIYISICISLYIYIYACIHIYMYIAVYGLREINAILADGGNRCLVDASEGGN